MNELLAAVKEALTDSFEVIPHNNNKFGWVCRFAGGKLRELREYMDTDLVTETFGTEKDT